MARLNKKRLAVDINDSLHDELTEMAKKYNVTITQIVTELIINCLIKNRDHDKTN